eukprot:365028-Chlamydomonas_euryale.AAC.19
MQSKGQPARSALKKQEVGVGPQPVQKYAILDGGCAVHNKLLQVRQSDSDSELQGAEPTWSGRYIYASFTGTETPYRTQWRALCDSALPAA